MEALAHRSATRAAALYPHYKLLAVATSSAPADGDGNRGGSGGYRVEILRLWRGDGEPKLQRRNPSLRGGRLVQHRLVAFSLRHVPSRPPCHRPRRWSRPRVGPLRAYLVSVFSSVPWIGRAKCLWSRFLGSSSSLCLCVWFPVSTLNVS